MKVAELAALVSRVRTALPVSIDLVSVDSNMRKTGNPYPNAEKHVTISGMIGCSYENAVNNQLGRENKELSFESQKPSWMQQSHLANLGTNKAGDKLYMPIKVQSCSKPIYMADGVNVTDAVKPFIRQTYAPTTQDDLTTKVIWRTPALDSIKTVRMLGAEYTID
jgi:hypothetical protein